MKRFLYKWHKRIGLVAASFVIVLVVTGIILNHSEFFQINKRYVNSEWLLNIYNIQAKNQPQSFQAYNNTITQIDERLYFNQKELLENIQALHGATIYEDEIVVAVDDELLLLTEQGDVIERLSNADGVPAGMSKIGSNNEQPLILQAAHGMYAADLDTLSWQEQDYENVQWIKPTKLSEEKEQALIQLYRGKGLSLERLVQDIHSGRIAGKFGVLIMDLAAILLLLLAISGFIMWKKKI